MLYPDINTRQSRTSVVVPGPTRQLNKGEIRIRLVGVNTTGRPIESSISPLSSLVSFVSSSGGDTAVSRSLFAAWSEFVLSSFSSVRRHILCFLDFHNDRDVETLYSEHFAGKRITRSPQALTHCLLFLAYKVKYVQACVSMHDNDRRSGIKPISEQ